MIPSEAQVFLFIIIIVVIVIVFVIAVSFLFCRLGYEVEEDRLKIPSTKRRCFIGLVPGGGLPSNIEEVIKELLSERKSNTFVARPKVERVSYFVFE